MSIVKAIQGRKTMKKLTVYSLAFLLVTATTAALAGGRNHGGQSGRHGGGHNYKHGGQHYNRHWSPPRYRRYNNHYRYDYYYPSYLGAALVGSALNYSLYHTHNGASCYDNHSSNQSQPRSGNYSEVVGCYRTERLSDGSERRVDVPMSQCQ
jgi:hypothetical protein